MGILKSTFVPTGRRLVLMFYGDNTFQFRKLLLKDSSVIIKKGEAIEWAWPALNKLTLPFAGLGSIKRTRALLACESDIILDPFNKLSDAEKPEKGPGLVKDWIQKKAETVRYRHQAKPKTSSIMNKVVVFLGSSLMLMVLVLIIVVLKERVG